MNVIQDCLTDLPRPICDLNVRCLSRMCAYLGIPFRYDLLSALELDLDGVGSRSDWAWIIGKQIGGTHYINPVGGRNWHLREDFESAGINLEFLKVRPYHYDQGTSDFEPDLSIIDVAMFNSPQEVRELVQNVDRHRIV